MVRIVVRTSEALTQPLADDVRCFIVARDELVRNKQGRAVFTATTEASKVPLSSCKVSPPEQIEARYNAEFGKVFGALAACATVPRGFPSLNEKQSSTISRRPSGGRDVARQGEGPAFVGATYVWVSSLSDLWTRTLMPTATRSTPNTMA